MINLLHIPEGVRDIYGSEGLNKSKLEASIMSCIHRYGYTDIETPTFEYFDIFNKERGTVPSKDMYKFFDREGNTLVLRPDITPAIARTAAKYYKEFDIPVRLCYRSKQFINHTGLQGKLKQTTQMGVELYNDDSVYADYEVISLTIDCIKAGNVKDFQLEIGVADFYLGIVEEAGLDEAQEATLRSILEQKNIFALDSFVADIDASDSVKRILGRLAELYGSIDIIDELKKEKLNEKSAKALNRLSELYELIRTYGYENHISFDLSMLSKYSYYTGIFFRAITYGSGEPIAYGGRYDNLVKQFGMDVPAIGMSITVDYLLMSLEREGLLPETEKNCTLIFYSKKNAGRAFDYAREIRVRRECCRLCPDETGEKYELFNKWLNGEADAAVVHNKFTWELETFDVKDIIKLCD